MTVKKNNPQRHTYNANNPDGLCHLGSILYAMGRLEDEEIRSIPGEYFKEDVIISEKTINIKHRIQKQTKEIKKIIEKGTGRKLIIENFPDIWKQKKII